MNPNSLDRQKYCQWPLTILLTKALNSQQNRLLHSLLSLHLKTQRKQASSTISVSGPSCSTCSAETRPITPMKLSYQKSLFNAVNAAAANTTYYLTFYITEAQTKNECTVSCPSFLFMSQECRGVV